MKKLTQEEFFAMFDEEVHDQLRERLTRIGVSGLIAFQNQDFCSSQFGARTAMVYGQECTYKCVADVEGQHLYDLPSQRQYPVAYFELSEDTNS